MEPIEMEYKKGIHIYLVNPRGEWTLGIQWFNYGTFDDSQWYEEPTQQEKCIVISLIFLQIKIGRACKEII